MNPITEISLKDFPLADSAGWCVYLKDALSPNQDTPLHIPLERGSDESAEDQIPSSVGANRSHQEAQTVSEPLPLFVDADIGEG